MKVQLFNILYFVPFLFVFADVSTADEPCDCDPPDGAEVEFFCPSENMLLNGLGSRSPFFGDALSNKCYDFPENLYDAAKENIYTFFSEDDGLTIKAQCGSPDDVIIRYKMCVKDAHVSSVTIHCSPLKDPARIEQVFNATSEQFRDALVDCGDQAGIQGLVTGNSGDGIISRVTFQCVRLSVE